MDLNREIPMPDIRYRPTWEDDIAGYDFVALDGNKRIGRIEMSPSGGKDVRWSWGSQFPGLPNVGYHPSMREAMLELEARYAAYLEKQG